MAYQRVPPASWQDLLADVSAFIDPLLSDSAGSLRAWDPAVARWTDEG